MKVWWSSTYVMLYHAKSQQQVSTSFYIVSSPIVWSAPDHSTFRSSRLSMSSFLVLKWRKQMLTTDRRFQLSHCTMKNGRKCSCSVTYSRCMSIQYLFNCYWWLGALNSTQTRPNRLSLQHLYQHSRMPCLPLRSCMHHGRGLLPRPAIKPLFQHSLLEWTSWTVITSKAQSQMCTSWPWVSHLSVLMTLTFANVCYSAQSYQENDLFLWALALRPGLRCWRCCSKQSKLFNIYILKTDSYSSQYKFSQILQCTAKEPVCQVSSSSQGSCNLQVYLP